MWRTQFSQVMPLTVSPVSMSLLPDFMGIRSSEKGACDD
jgi:hypothetical protein